MVSLTRETIDTAAMVAGASQAAAGAVLLFVGITRELTQGRQTEFLEYEAYEQMALAEMEQLRMAANKRWGLTSCSIVHRLGRVDISEASVAVVVSSAHRDGAFEAGRWLIDELKQSVPIWKKEHWRDGSTAWVHPSGKPMESAPHG